jgi:hypothetical protein
MLKTDDPYRQLLDVSGKGSGASADNSLRSAAEALKSTLVSDGKRLEIRHFCFAACGSSIRQEVFAGLKSLDAPEPGVFERTENSVKSACYRARTVSDRPTRLEPDGLLRQGGRRYGVRCARR